MTPRRRITSWDIWWWRVRHEYGPTALWLLVLGAALWTILTIRSCIIGPRVQAIRTTTPLPALVEEATAVEIVHGRLERRRAALSAAIATPDADERTRRIHALLVAPLLLLLCGLPVASAASPSPVVSAAVEPAPSLPASPDDCAEQYLLPSAPVTLACRGHVITDARAVSCIDARDRAEALDSLYRICTSARTIERESSTRALHEAQDAAKAARRRGWLEGAAVGAATILVAAVLL